MAMISWQMVEQNKPLVRAEADTPEPGAGEVRIHVAGAPAVTSDIAWTQDRLSARLEVAAGGEREVGARHGASKRRAASWC